MTIRIRIGGYNSTLENRHYTGPPLSATRLPVSLTIITLNAAAQLEACIASAPFVDEVLVVDSGSKDGTVELAERLGARVVQQVWLGYGRQKQFAVDAAKNDWVLCLDADERLSSVLRTHLEAALSAPDAKAYRFARCNRFLGRFLRHGEGYPDWSLRLFDRRVACWSTDPVHEKVVTATPVQTVAGDLIHDSAETLQSYLSKQNRYTSLAAEQAFAAGKRSSFGRLVFSPLLRFLKFYLLRQGFRDGVPGLIHIWIGCCNSFLKHAKLIELARQQVATR